MPGLRRAVAFLANDSREFAAAKSRKAVLRPPRDTIPIAKRAHPSHNAMNDQQ